MLEVSFDPWRKGFSFPSVLETEEKKVPLDLEVGTLMEDVPWELLCISDM